MRRWGLGGAMYRWSKGSFTLHWLGGDGIGQEHLEGQRVNNADHHVTPENGVLETYRKSETGREMIYSICKSFIFQVETADRDSLAK